MAWSYPPGADLHFTSAGDSHSAGGNGESAMLAQVNINTAAASAVLTVYKGPFSPSTPSTTGTKVATIDCSNNSSRSLTYMIRCPGGIYAQLTGGNADVSLIYI